MKTFFSALFLAVCFCTFATAQNLEKAKILEKPKAVWNYKNPGQICAQGTVIVIVELLATGNVGKVELIHGLPFGLSEAAVEAVKQIKFEPAKKDGVPITTVKTFGYQFGWALDRDFIIPTSDDEKAEAVIQKAVKRLGGERYLAVKTVTGRGNFTPFPADKQDLLPLPQAFTDYIVYPNKERAEFKSGGARTIQVNTGDAGWIADTAARSVKDQTAEQIADYKNSLRTSLDYLLRGSWRKTAKLSYIGRREASLGKRNDAVRLVYEDGLTVDFEFADDGTPAKTVYKRKNGDGEDVTEEDRFAQFVEIGGVFAAFIIDRYRDGKQISRINYSSIEYNTQIPEQLFVKPADAKKLK